MVVFVFVHIFVTQAWVRNLRALVAFIAYRDVNQNSFEKLNRVLDHILSAFLRFLFKYLLLLLELLSLFLIHLIICLLLSEYFLKCVLTFFFD